MSKHPILIECYSTTLYTLTKHCPSHQYGLNVTRNSFPDSIFLVKYVIIVHNIKCYGEKEQYHLFLGKQKQSCKQKNISLTRFWHPKEEEGGPFTTVNSQLFPSKKVVGRGKIGSSQQNTNQTSAVDSFLKKKVIVLYAENREVYTSK